MDWEEAFRTVGDRMCVLSSMRTVRILKYWKYPNLMRQTPKGSGIWGNTRFVVDVPGEADYICVSDHVASDMLVKCPRSNVWLVMPEPPDEVHQEKHKGAPLYGRVFHQDVNIVSAKHVLSHGALPWHVDKTYDELSSEVIPEKTNAVSWITSNQLQTEGHRKRMRFLAELKDEMQFDLFGKGFHPLRDKWEGLAPYKYSIAIENFENPWYWTEKIIDPLLAWCMPIYCGCKEIEKFLPTEALFRFSMDDPAASRKIRQFLESDPWSTRKEAISEARNRILNEHQMFPFLAKLIEEYERAHGVNHSKKYISLYDPTRGKGGIRTRLRRFLRERVAPISAMFGRDPFSQYINNTKINEMMVSPHSGLPSE